MFTTSVNADKDLVIDKEGLNPNKPELSYYFNFQSYFWFILILQSKIQMKWTCIDVGCLLFL